MLRLYEFSHNHRPSGVKMLAKYIKRKDSAKAHLGSQFFMRLQQSGFE